MTTEIHCTACDAIIPHGAQFCPGCGLRITTQAAPAVYVEGPRFSFWTVIIAASGALLILAMLLK